MISAPRQRSVAEYYHALGSRLGYKYILGGTRHFGLYESGDSRWRFRPAMRRMEDYLGTTLGLPEGSYVLDAGCGVGDVARRLAENFSYRVHGIDLLDSNIEDAKERAVGSDVAEAVSFELMDYSRLTFKDAHFDGVYTMETLVHASDAEQVLREFFRVLRPGGRIALFEYTHDVELTERQAQAMVKVNALASMPSFARFSLGYLDSALNRCGFEKIESRDMTAAMMPMFSAFATMARIPYEVTKLFGKPDLFVNAMSAVEFWEMRDVLHYMVYVAQRPVAVEAR
jgi:sterol 24-C-methyltransferase